MFTTRNLSTSSNPTTPHPFSSVGIINRLVSAEFDKYNKLFKSTYRNDVDINKVTSALGYLNRINLKLRPATDAKIAEILDEFQLDLKRAAKEAEKLKSESPITYNMTIEDIKVAQSILDKIINEHKKCREKVDGYMRSERAYRNRNTKQRDTSF